MPERPPFARDTSVYIHFPWCLQKCPYCDFATKPIARDRVPHEPYADAVIRELELRAPSIEGRRLVSIFFGGGTPSLWDARSLGRVLERVRGAFTTTEPNLEITVECNPSSLDDDRARALLDVGVNRISLGVQSLDDARLKFLGRIHDKSGALRALDAGLRVFDRMNADLIFGIHGQREEAFAAEIDTLLSRGIKHVSAYMLTIEPGTRFGELYREGRLPIAEDDSVADAFVLADERFSRAGFVHYEVSNYALPGQESRHNMHYWRGGSYLGLGAAAVGCLVSAAGAARRTTNLREPERYLAAVERADLESLAAEAEDLGANDLVREGIMLGLRTAEGLDLAALRARSGAEPRDGRRSKIERRVARGDLIEDGDRWRVPTQRWLSLDGITADLF